MCVYVCVCTLCLQVPWRAEDIGSSGTGAIGDGDSGSERGSSVRVVSVLSHHSISKGSSIQFLKDKLMLEWVWID